MLPQACNRFAAATADLFEECLSRGVAQHLSKSSYSIDAQRLMTNVASILKIEANEFVVRRRFSIARQQELYYPVDLADLKAAGSRGTLIVQDIQLDDPELASLALLLTDRLSCRVSISAYIAPANAETFDWHVDRWHAVVFQLFGTKRFFFKGAPDATLTAGDVVFIKKDVLHRAEAPETSVHLSISAHAG